MINASSLSEQLRLLLGYLQRNGWTIVFMLAGSVSLVVGRWSDAVFVESTARYEDTPHDDLPLWLTV